jgi:hypothetical protein
MKKYLAVLLSDIAEAKNNRPDFRPISDDEIIPFELDDFWEANMEDSAESEAQKPTAAPKRTGNIREIMGLNREQFPPADYWTEEEAAQLVIALNDLLGHYHLAADYPPNLPPLMAYSTLVGALELYAPIMPFGEWHLEFCNYNPEECPFGEAYCGCNNIYSSDLVKTDEEKFIESMDHPDNIPSVYNYCDGWCERCRFDRRCSVSRLLPSLSETDEEPEIFELSKWQDDTEKLAAAKNWLKTQSSPIISPLKEERDIFDTEMNEVRRDIKRVAVVQLAARYESDLSKWLKTDKIKTLVETIDNPLTDKENAAQETVLKTTLSVILWYVHFIRIKLSRAVRSKIEDKDFMDFHDIPTDSDGSAKIALIGADNSFVAWYDLLQIMPEEKDFAAKMMFLLQAVIEEGEREFSEARAFMRAGFDEMA